ncbi:hypothetical protein LSCM1_05729 [Leishmania martiniquensis]|uniref:EF-hand domain-containing protein n=1 Tax=Leishmania martiniquensis TaxID=1580590 RepID=A0A836KTB9_9TRYP|nr:hypothetical protein LSCM1_05729 [Leishmania martiniquensis]
MIHVRKHQGTKSRGMRGEEKTTAERKAVWKKIRPRLPREETPENGEHRNELFKRFDQNGTGKLIMEETY